MFANKNITSQLLGVRNTNSHFLGSKQILPKQKIQINKIDEEKKKIIQ